LLHLSAYFEENRQTYYALLLATSQQGAWREWLDYFLKGVIAQSQDTIERIKRLQDLQQHWHGILQMSKASGSTLRLADYLFESPMITIPRAQRILEMKSYRGAQRVVDKLIELGMLMPLDERSYGKNYLARDILSKIFAERTEG
jgi:Fic family protein